MMYSYTKEKLMGKEHGMRSSELADSANLFTIAFGMTFLKNYGAIIDMGRGEECRLGSFKVGRDKHGNMKYGLVAPSFIDIEDDMEGHWGNKGYGRYKKFNGDGDWHARFEIVTPSGRKFNRAFKTKTTTRKLSGKFKAEDVFRKGALEYQGLLTGVCLMVMVSKIP
ncbi:hypothetical protein Tco_0275997 [Tanacetum coccineum]